MKISLIVAMAKNRVIGNENKLPWHLPEDLKRFKELTMGKCVIVGRKTFESIGKPLPGRQMIVVTSNRKYLDENRSKDLRVIFASSFENALKIAGLLRYDEVFIAGGFGIYRQALEDDIVDRLYITMVHDECKGDTVFPNFDMTKWKPVKSEARSKYTFLEYERNNG